MISLSSRFLAGTTLAALALGLASCGADAPHDVATVSGSYSATWTLEVLRLSDGFQTQFSCPGRLTLSQGAATGGVLPISGFATVSPPCAPESYSLNGTLAEGGVIDFTTGGPPPTQGPCPGGRNVHFSGQFERSSGIALSLSVRGATQVQCPEFGAHTFTYLLNARAM
jgi:hypothetical protein